MARRGHFTGEGTLERTSLVLPVVFPPHYGKGQLEGSILCLAEHFLQAADCPQTDTVASGVLQGKACGGKGGAGFLLEEHPWGRWLWGFPCHSEFTRVLLSVVRVSLVCRRRASLGDRGSHLHTSACLLCQQGELPVGIVGITPSSGSSTTKFPGPLDWPCQAFCSFKYGTSLKSSLVLSLCEQSFQSRPVLLYSAEHGHCPHCHHWCTVPGKTSSKHVLPCFAEIVWVSYRLPLIQLHRERSRPTSAPATCYRDTNQCY